jgi:hypothetical protein
MNRRGTVPPHCRGSVIQCVTSAWEERVDAAKTAAPALAKATFTPDWARVEMAETAWG